MLLHKIIRLFLNFYIIPLDFVLNIRVFLALLTQIYLQFYFSLFAPAKASILKRT